MAGIPAPTGEEEKRREYIKRLVEEWNEKIADPERKFEVHEDKAGNISVRVPDSKGSKDRPVAVVQAHLDMVTEGGNDKAGTQCVIDRRDGYLKSLDQKTTLGADNGAGVTSMLQLMDDIANGRIQDHVEFVFLFTVGEEAAEPTLQEDDVTYDSRGGLYGARHLDAKEHFGHLGDRDVVYINTDSEDGIQFYTVDSAAGSNMLIQVNTRDQRDEINRDLETIIVVDMKGFKSGHSALAIAEGHGNAIAATGHALKWLVDNGIEVRPVEIEGGTQPNAIASESHCTFAIPTEQLTKAQYLLDQLKKGTSTEWRGVLAATGHRESKDPDNHPQLEWELALEGRFTTKLNQEASQDLITLLTELPTGPITLKPTKKTPTEKDEATSSNNIGKIRTTKNGEVVMSLLPRAQEGSAQDKARGSVPKGSPKLGTLAYVLREIRAALNQTHNSEIVYEAPWDSWKELGSPAAVQAWEEACSVFLGITPKSKPTQGGLEAALVLAALRDPAIGANSVSGISVGPPVKEGHSRTERMKWRLFVLFDLMLRYKLLRLAKPDAHPDDLVREVQESLAPAA